MAQENASTTPTPPVQAKIVQPVCAIFRRFLKSHNLKFTQERALILDHVLSSDGVFEADQLLREMQDAEAGVSKATIYRTLKHLVEADILQEVIIDAQRTHYRLSYGRGESDHIVNVDDDSIIEFQSPELVELVERICREHGLERVGHRLLIYGTRDHD